MHIITNPWPWYVSGPLIAFTMILLIYLGKYFGMSSNLRTLCTICGAGKTSAFFRFDWKSQKWNLLIVAGAVVGGFIASHYLSDNQVPAISSATIKQLHDMGFESAGKTYEPTELFGKGIWSDPQAIFILLAGGILVGFGSRYAGGCTSGHSISGISNLQLPSLIATTGFFIGGLIMVHFIYPFLF